MRSKFLAENRWLLKLCSEAARFVGLLALLAAGVFVALLVVLAMSNETMPDAAKASRTDLLSKIPAIAFYGFLALILAEFLSYLLVEQGEPKWILRHGDKVIYAYLLYFVVMSIYAARQMSGAERPPGIDLHRVLDLAFLVVSIAVKVLIWVGIAIVLRKVVPIIRESKTLV